MHTTQNYYQPTRHEQNMIDSGDAVMTFFLCAVMAAWFTVSGYYRNKHKHAVALQWEVEQEARKAA